MSPHLFEGGHLISIMFDIRQFSSSFFLSISPQSLAAYSRDQNDIYKQLIYPWVYEPDGSHARINISSLLFWTTCIATMAGCGLLFRRSDTKRPFVRDRHHRKHANLTVTSSEDDSDECTTPSRKLSAVEEKESAAGYRRFSPNGTYMSAIPMS